jgi:hypothetical protein
MDPLALDQPEDFSADTTTRRADQPADYSAAADRLRLFSERQDKSGGLYHPEEGQRGADKLEIFPADRASRGSSSRHDAYSSNSGGHLGQERSRLYPVPDRDKEGMSDDFSNYVRQSAREKVDQFSAYGGSQRSSASDKHNIFPSALDNIQIDRGKHQDDYSTSFGHHLSYGGSSGQRSSDKLEIFPSDSHAISKRSRNFGLDNSSTASDKLEIFPTDNNLDKSRSARFSSYGDGDQSSRNKRDDYSLYSHQQQQAAAARDKAERFPPCAQTATVKDKPEDFSSRDLDKLEVFPSSTEKIEDDFTLDGHNRPKTENLSSDSPTRVPSPQHILGKTEIFSSDENEPTESEKFEFYSSHGKKIKEKMASFVEDSHALKPQDIVLDYLKSREKSAFCHRYDAVLWCEEGSVKIHR